jgi:hypothetical protein
VNFVKAKRILTGLPDDRKNFSHSQALRGKKKRTKNGGRKNISSDCAFCFIFLSVIFLSADCVVVSRRRVVLLFLLMRRPKSPNNNHRAPAQFPKGVSL